MPMMPFIGVRISWLMFARNSLFAALASIAWSRAFTNCSLLVCSSAVRASDLGARAESTNAILPVETQQILRTACAVGFQRARMSSIYKYLRGIDPVTGDPNHAVRVGRLKVLDQEVDQCPNEPRRRDSVTSVNIGRAAGRGGV